MALGVITNKRGMTTVLAEDGASYPVTLVEYVPMTVIQIKTEATDGYNAIQVAYEPIRAHKLSKAAKVHQAKEVKRDKNKKITDIIFYENGPFKKLKEFRVEDPKEFELGQLIDPSIISEGITIDAIGVTKGKGFAGAMKRYHFHGQSSSHGVKGVHRKPMSAGATDAARTFKGKKMPGHMGNVQFTQKNLKVIKVDSELHLYALKGAVPGPTGGEIVIKPAKGTGH